MKAETAVIALDLDGVAVSSGSACSSGKVAAVARAGRHGRRAGARRGAIRVSLGYATTEEDVERFLKAWEKLVERTTIRRKQRTSPPDGGR